jgi:peroxiredoxin
MLSLGISLPLLTGAEVPRPAPEFVLKLHDGKQLLLSSFRGKVVALEFLLTTCPHCKTCSSLMNNLYRELGPKGFQPLGVAFNPMSGLFVADYVRELKLDFPVGVAEREPVLNFLQHSPLERMLVPQIVFIDRNGVIRAQYSADHDFFKDEEKNMRAQVEALLKEPANRRNPARTKKPASSQAQPAVQ